MNKLFVILGNQLFDPKFLKKYQNHTFFMAEDYGLCTFQKHHKQKIVFFLSAMRSYLDELKKIKLKVTYKKIEDKNFKIPYEKKLIKEISKRKIGQVSIFEIEDKDFEKKLLNLLVLNPIKVKYNNIKSNIDKNIIVNFLRLLIIYFM